LHLFLISYADNMEQSKTQRTQKTRFVCISDTHNAGGAFKLPKGDVLIHAGDLTNNGTYKELEKAAKWLEEADFGTKIVIGGMSGVGRVIPFYMSFSKVFRVEML